MWIKTSDSLPEMGRVVLTFSEEHGVLPQCRRHTHILGNDRVAYSWQGPGPFSNFAHRVTHWMELPEPPKTTKEEKEKFCDDHCTWLDHHPDCGFGV